MEIALGLLFRSFVCTLILVGGYRLYTRRQRERMFAGTIYYPDGRPLDTRPDATEPTPPTAPGANGTYSSSKDASISHSQTVTRQRPGASLLLAPVPLALNAFAGDDQFGWYREGDLTWRLDTESGFACVALATPRAWENPQIYSRRCAQK